MIGGIGNDTGLVFAAVGKAQQPEQVDRPSQIPGDETVKSQSLGPKECKT